MNQDQDNSSVVVMLLLIILVMIIIAIGQGFKISMNIPTKEVCTENKIFKDFRPGDYGVLYYIDSNDGVYKSTETYPLNEVVCTKKENISA